MAETYRRRRRQTTIASDMLAWVLFSLSVMAGVLALCACAWLVA